MSLPSEPLLISLLPIEYIAIEYEMLNQSEPRKVMLVILLTL